MNRRSFFRALIGAAASPIVGRLPALPAPVVWDLCATAKPLFESVAEPTIDLDTALAALWADNTITPQWMVVSDEAYAIIQGMR